MAQAIFNELCPQGFLADSAGISTSFGKPVSDNSVRALDQINISIDHSSRMITQSDFSEFDYIIGITAAHARVLSEAFPQFKSKIFAFPADVNDPYGSNLDEYVKCRDIIYDGVKKIIGQLENE